ncbi:zf-TFIIB domain-containing protein [Pseudonocardia sp. MH-G8]|uniref:TFIIB-type zinc ribbon-containing protein n=1 Tax=Pseudonocardia sp. MH-G8 TaxID=1854588 RepID=UPI000BA11940|nr:zf-TFIIB domain-containing protein [Pseudonocardia sp. MH-G8]OZM79014.1 transcriptional regulator [Pseudonocardia sp. MH-G8]
MICPKCQSRMHTVDRRGVHIEQCQGCRGIFLDRGELEQIANAEQSFYGGHSAPPAYGQDSPPPYGGQRGHDPRHQGGRRYGDSPPPHGGRYSDSPPPRGHRYNDSPPPHGHRGHKGRGGFLGELFG